MDKPLILCGKVFTAETDKEALSLAGRRAFDLPTEDQPGNLDQRGLPSQRLVNWKETRFQSDRALAWGVAEFGYPMPLAAGCFLKALSIEQEGSGLGNFNVELSLG